jgi:hypothetical protein
MAVGKSRHLCSQSRAAASCGSGVMSIPLPSSKYWLERAEGWQVLEISVHNPDVCSRMRKADGDYQRMGIEAATRELVEAHGVKE